MQQLPIQITFRQMDHSSALEQKIRDRVAQLQQFYADVKRCDVAVEKHHRRHQQGNIFRVRIHITVPGEEILVSRESGKNHAHEDPYVTVRDAFDTARRQLEEHARQQDQRAKRRDRDMLSAENDDSSKLIRI